MGYIRSIVSMFLDVLIVVDARRNDKKLSRELRTGRDSIRSPVVGHCSIVEKDDEGTGPVHGTNYSADQAIRGGQQTDGDGDGGIDDVHSRAEVISAEYTEARAQHRDALDGLLKAMADKCVEETKAGHVRDVGLRCQQCEFFHNTRCTLRDKIAQ